MKNELIPATHLSWLTSGIAQIATAIKAAALDPHQRHDLAIRLRRFANLIDPVDAKKIPRTIPPPIDWVYEYCDREQLTIDPDEWFDHYEQQDWVLGTGNKMKNWQAAVRTWERRSKPGRPSKRERKKQAVKASLESLETAFLQLRLTDDQDAGGRERAAQLFE